MTAPGEAQQRAAEEVEMRMCFTCGVEKPLLTEYYKSPTGAKGRDGRCRACYTEYCRTVRHRNPARYRETKRAYYQTHREEKTAQLKAYREKNPEKAAAGQKLRAAVKKGEVVKPECCEKCGTEAQVHGHHEDYGKPLEARWLCPPCHMEIHRQMAREAK